MHKKHFFILAILGLLTGCSSISKGITEAIMERESKDDRQCWITGRSFVGLDDLFNAEVGGNSSGGAPARLKVMSVHGIGTHVPGYSRRMLDGLVAELGFKNADETVKTIELSAPEFPDGIGVLTAHRYMNLERTREMLYYELTWDSIVEEEKKNLDFDNTLESSTKRAAFNHTMKTFVNDTVPDALIYNTRFRDPIQRSFAQSLCWMLSEKWENLPNNERRNCDIRRKDLWSQIDDSNFAIISHSLGSRISFDSLEETVVTLSKDPNYQAVSDKLKDKPMYLYMMSNQLPLLQVGRRLPEVHDEVSAICDPQSDRHEERFFEKLQIVAFSDPNDLFSYVVKPSFINRNLDSRICPAVTNVVIEVAHVSSLFGGEAFSNPLKAHTEYEADSRVLKMVVSGFGRSHGQEEPKTRCDFIETFPDY